MSPEPVIASPAVIARSVATRQSMNSDFVDCHVADAPRNDGVKAVTAGPSTGSGQAEARQSMQFADKPMPAVQGANAVIIVTECNAYRSPNWTALRAAMKSSVVFDGRNLYEPQAMLSIGIDYAAIGRGRA